MNSVLAKHEIGFAEKHKLFCRDTKSAREVAFNKYIKTKSVTLDGDVFQRECAYELELAYYRVIINRASCTRQWQAGSAPRALTVCDDAYCCIVLRAIFSASAAAAALTPRGDTVRTVVASSTVRY